MIRQVNVIIYSLLIIVSFNTNTSEKATHKQKTISFQKSEKLQNYFPLDKIMSVELENWKGKHTLTKHEIDQFRKDLDGYICDGRYSATKPGHFWCNITFQDRTYLYFYSNSRSEIIIST